MQDQTDKFHHEGAKTRSYFLKFDLLLCLLTHRFLFRSFRTFLFFVVYGLVN